MDTGEEELVPGFVFVEFLKSGSGVPRVKSANLVKACMSELGAPTL